MSDDEFVSADSGAAGTTPIRVGELKKGMMVMIKGHACKIVDYSTVRGQPSTRARERSLARRAYIAVRVGPRHRLREGERVEHTTLFFGKALHESRPLGLDRRLDPYGVPLQRHPQCAWHETFAE